MELHPNIDPEHITNITETAKANASAAPAKTKETKKPSLSTATGAANEADGHVKGAF